MEKQTENNNKLSSTIEDCRNWVLLNSLDIKNTLKKSKKDFKMMTRHNSWVNEENP